MINNTQEEIIKRIVHEFDGAMAERTALVVRIGRRTTQIIRIATLGILILALAMFYLIYTLSSDMKKITGHMIEMEKYMLAMQQDFDSVALHMNTMQLSVAGMNKHVSVLPIMQESVNGMNESMVYIYDNMEKMSNDMVMMRKNLKVLTENLTVINTRFKYLYGNVNMLGQDVNRISSPFEMLPR